MAHKYIFKEGTPEYVGDILSALETQGDLNATWQRCFEAYQGEIEKLWKDTAELRDELHALANRVETLTRARLTEPAEVAERIIPRNTPHQERLGREIGRFRKDVRDA